MRLNLLLLFLFWSITSNGCFSDIGLEDSRIDFGYHYSILEHPSPPTLLHDTLVVHVAYSGCSGGHAFTLQHRISGSSQIELWLHKDTPDQVCDAYWNELRRWRLPESFRTHRSVALVDPRGKRFILR